MKRRMIDAGHVRGLDRIVERLVNLVEESRCFGDSDEFSGLSRGIRNP